MGTRLLPTILLCTILGFPASALAVFGFGLHGGLDLYTVDSDSLTFELRYPVQGSRAKASLQRDEISSPLVLGGRFYVDVLPIVDVEVSTDVAVREYAFTFTRETPGSREVRTDELTFGRIGLYATVRKDAFSVPPVVHVVTAYIGGGLGLHFVSPVLCPQLFMDKLPSADTTLDIDEFVKKGAEVGAHALVGIRVRPPLIPLIVDAEAKYTRMPKGDYKQPNAFSTVYVGLLLDF